MILILAVSPANKPLTKTTAESIFAIPGVGKMMVDAIKARNYPVVQGGVLMVALTFSLVNLAVDILYAFVDPRIRSQYK